MIHWKIEGTCRSLKEVPKGAKVIEVNGCGVIGVCEYCGTHILSINNFHRWADGVVTCNKCGGKRRKEHGV